jgi:hypothetical protein
LFYDGIIHPLFHVIIIILHLCTSRFVAACTLTLYVSDSEFPCWSFKFHYPGTNTFSSLSHDRSKHFPKPALHIVRPRAFSVRCEYPLFSLRSSSNFLRQLLLLFTSIPPFVFPSITCCRRQFLCKIWPIKLAKVWCIIRIQQYNIALSIV